MSATTEPSPYTRDWLQNVLQRPGDPPKPPRARTLDHQPGEHPMSFSFAAKGKTKQALKDDIAKKMAAVVEGQPVHARDQGLVNETASKYVDFLKEPADNEVLTASVNGSISTSNPTAGEPQVHWANVGVSVGCTIDNQAP